VRWRVVGAGVGVVATALVSVVAALTFGLAGSVAAATVTIGQLGGSGTSCAADLDLVQPTPTSLAVPSGNWTVTSWSTQAGQGQNGPFAGQLQLEMWRPTATPNAFMLVGISPVVTTTASGLNTFTLASPIAVQGGDLLGLRNITDHYGCATTPASGNADGQIDPTPPTPGATVTFSILAVSVIVNVTATLQSVTPPTPPTTTPAPAVAPVAAFTG